MENKIYLLMNKPAGYVCSAVSDSHHTVYELLTPELQDLVQNAKRGQRLHTVGRLDCETSGLLLFTTDGIFSHKLTAPDLAIEKTYIADLEKPGTLEYITLAEQGLTLPPEKKAPEQKAGPARLHPLNAELTKWEITVTEGKFHEVRRLFRALGNEVVKLKRIRIGDFVLPDGLDEGEWVPVTPKGKTTF